MSDWFYNLVYALGWGPLRLSSSPLVLHREIVSQAQGCILAPNHLSPYDIPCLMAATGRVLDFVSITELFRSPFAAWFLRHMGAFPLDRWRPDPPTVRLMLDRLHRGRLLVLFPEGNIRTGQTSLLSGGSFKPGVLRLAQLAKVPILPCVLLGTRAYSRPISWLPLTRTTYAVTFGQPLSPIPNLPAMESALRQSYDHLHHEIRQVLVQRGKKLTHDDFAPAPNAGSNHG